MNIDAESHQHTKYQQTESNNMLKGDSLVAQTAKATLKKKN